VSTGLTLSLCIASACGPARPSLACDPLSDSARRRLPSWIEEVPEAEEGKLFFVGRASWQRKPDHAIRAAEVHAYGLALQYAGAGKVEDAVQGSGASDELLEKFAAFAKGKGCGVTFPKSTHAKVSCTLTPAEKRVTRYNGFVLAEVVEEKLKACVEDFGLRVDASLSPHAGTFRPGEALGLRVAVSRPAYVYVLAKDRSDRTRLIFPGHGAGAVHVRPGEPLLLPDERLSAEGLVWRAGLADDLEQCESRVVVLAACKPLAAAERSGDVDTTELSEDFNRARGSSPSDCYGRAELAVKVVRGDSGGWSEGARVACR